VTKNDQTTLMGPFLAAINTSSSRLSQRHPPPHPYLWTKSFQKRYDTLLYAWFLDMTTRLDSTRYEFCDTVAALFYFLYNFEPNGLYMNACFCYFSFGVDWDI
jgi:hypothetical protein